MFLVYCLFLWYCLGSDFLLACQNIYYHTQNTDDAWNCFIALRCSVFSLQALVQLLKCAGQGAHICCANKLHTILVWAPMGKIDKFSANETRMMY